MAIGISLVLVAAGAIFRYAVTEGVNGVQLPTVGLVLIIVGIIGLAFSLLELLLWAPRRRRLGERDRGYEELPRRYGERGA